MVELETLDDMEDAARTFKQAAELFEMFIETEQEMLEEGELENGETAAEMQDDMETAKETCEAMSVAVTLMLARNGVVVDFDEDADGDDFDGHGIM